MREGVCLTERGYLFPSERVPVFLKEGTCLRERGFLSFCFSACRSVGLASFLYVCFSHTQKLRRAEGQAELACGRWKKECGRRVCLRRPDDGRVSRRVDETENRVGIMRRSLDSEHAQRWTEDFCLLTNTRNLFSSLSISFSVRHTFSVSVSVCFSFSLSETKVLSPLLFLLLV